MTSILGFGWVRRGGSVWGSSASRRFVAGGAAESRQDHACHDCHQEKPGQRQPAATGDARSGGRAGATDPGRRV